MIFNAHIAGSRLSRVFIGWILCLRGLSGLLGQDASYSQMDLLDDERLLEIGDRFVYLVEEEKEAEINVFINGRGNVKLPLIGEVLALGKQSASSPRA